MRILVTGAAGYIGSAVTEHLVENGADVMALDNLQNGHMEAVHPKAHFVHGDLLNGKWLKSFLVDNPVDSVVHLAAEALIDESLSDPGKFYRTNVYGGLNLLEAMVAAGVKRIVNSSTAAVYGEPREVPIREDSALSPINTYGETKLVFERMMEWYQITHDIKYISLRYFNVCGATERFGEDHNPETHIIPTLLDVALGQRDTFYLNGTDYDTPDGTCIRDYIHLIDIARAHISALGAIDHVKARAYNIGNGNGYSNHEVIETVRKVTGRDIQVVNNPKRPGDPSRLIASSERIQKELGWSLKYPELETMIKTAWGWRKNHHQGYKK